MSPLRSRFGAAGAILFVAWLCIEASVSLASTLAPSLFSVKKQIIRAVDTVPDAKFKEFADTARLPQVWDTTANFTSKSVNCLQEATTASYDASGARRYPGYDVGRARVMLVGDSFTHGDEVSDESTISAHLHRDHGIMTINLGVGGYSPVQAYMKAARVRDLYPDADTVVLGVMFENIRRLVSSNLSVFDNHPSSPFGVRPYVKDGVIRTVPEAVLESKAALATYVRKTVEEDFWRLPEASFPYTIALYRLVASNHFQLRNASRINMLRSRQYMSDFANAELDAALAVVVRDFLQWAERARLKGVVIFVPQNGKDIASPLAWIERFKQQNGTLGRVQMANMTGVDWAKYNLKPNGSCHPSPYGYGMIARAYANALGNLKN